MTIAQQKEPARDLVLYHPVGEAIAMLFHPHAEVVLHDLVSGRVAGIWNAFSARQVGDPSNLGSEAEFDADQSIIGPYEKAEKDGSRVKSVTAVLRDADGSRIGFLCVNMDMSKFDGAVELLRAFTSSSNAMPEALFKGDLREQVNLILRNELLRINKTVPVLNRNDRLRIVDALERANIFHARNAVPLVGSTLGMSRATVYDLLRTVRERGSAGSDRQTQS